VLGTIDIATTIGNHWYFTRRLSRGGDMGPELGDAEDVRPSGDSMTFKAVKALAFAMPFIAIPVVLGFSHSVIGERLTDWTSCRKDLNSPVWGTVNEAFDGAFPVLSGLLFSSFPEWFGARPQTAHLIRCRVFKRHASVRVITGAAGADFPSVLAGLADLSGVKWPGHLLGAFGSGLSGESANSSPSDDPV
jgi:hypothetical protein